MRVAFQGEPAAFGEEAAVRLAARLAAASSSGSSSGCVPVPVPAFDDVARMVAARGAELGVLPVENLIAGPVAAACLTLAGWAPPLHAAAEAALPVRLCLLALPGADPAGLRAARSHPVALAQCGRFFRHHAHILPVASHDTAGAAREVAERGDPAVAAIAGPAAAERYGLEILAAGIQDRADNATRFVAVSRAAPPPVTPGAPARTLLALTAPRAPLRAVLAPFSTRHIPVCTLLALPTGLCLLQLDHPGQHPSVDDALADARSRLGDVRVVGQYEMLD